MIAALDAARRVFYAASVSVHAAHNMHVCAMRAFHAHPTGVRVKRKYEITAAALDSAVAARDRALLAVYAAKDAE